MRAKAISLVLVCTVLSAALASGDLVVYNELPFEYYWKNMEPLNGISLNIDRYTVFGIKPENGTISENGTFCAKINYDRDSEDWAGVFIQVTDNWERGPGIGKNLTGAKKLVFHARGDKGGEHVAFGYGFDLPDKKGFTDSSYERLSENLTNQWKEFKFDLYGKNLSSISGLFMFYVDKYQNPEKIKFYIDNITYVY